MQIWVMFTSKVAPKSPSIMDPQIFACCIDPPVSGGMKLPSYFNPNSFFFNQYWCRYVHCSSFILKTIVENSKLLFADIMVEWQQSPGRRMTFSNNLEDLIEATEMRWFVIMSGMVEGGVSPMSMETEMDQDLDKVNWHVFVLVFWATHPRP